MPKNINETVHMYELDLKLYQEFKSPLFTKKDNKNNIKSTR